MSTIAAGQPIDDGPPPPAPDFGETLRGVAATPPVTGNLFKDAWTWRHLVRAFVLYDIKHDKRDNLMGNVWHLLNPVLNMLIFMFVVQVVFGGRVENFGVFFFCGSMFFRAWTLAFSRGTSVLIQAGGLIKSCYFPRITVVLPVTIKGLYDLAIESVVLAALIVGYAVFADADVVPGWTILLVIPLVVLTYLGSTGAVLLLSCLGARFRDVTNLIQHVNRLFFYFSPVMYPVDFVPEHLQSWYMLNPVTCAIEIARDVIYRDELPDPFIAAWYAGFCLLMLVVGMTVFSRLQGRVTKFL